MLDEPEFDDPIDDFDDDIGSDDEMVSTPQPTLDETLAAIRAAETDGFTRILYYGLANLEPQTAIQMQQELQSLPDELRHRLFEHLVDISEMNFELDYNELALAALEDRAPQVRASAVELLWSETSTSTLRRLLDLVLEDDSALVRAAAVGALGSFILAGEYDEIPPDAADSAVDVCLSIYHDEDEDIEVRRRALEALGNSSSEGIDALILEAYQSSERLMRVSAVFAMGRTADLRWETAVLRELSSDDPELRYEAARAAGELELESAVARLSRMAYENDREIKEVSVWALGEIGTRAAAAALETLSEEPDFLEDEELQKALEDALAAASLPGRALLMLDGEEDDSSHDLIRATDESSEDVNDDDFGDELYFK